jgi:uncharacterized protein
VHTRLRGPLARMAPADDIDGAAKASPLYAKYGTRADRQSAHELLAERMESAAPDEAKPEEVLKRKEPERASRDGGGDPLTDFLSSREGRRVQREVIRGVFGMLRKRL